MGLDYSQKRLLNMALKKGKGKSPLPIVRKRRLGAGLEVYAFWTGFASTIVSVVQVLVTALKK